MSKEEDNEIIFNEFNVDLRKLMQYNNAYSKIIDLAITKGIGEPESLNKAKIEVDGILQGLVIMHNILTMEKTMEDYNKTFLDLIKHALNKINCGDDEYEELLLHIEKNIEDSERELKIEKGYFKYE